MGFPYKPAGVFVAFLVAGAALYARTAGGGFVTDQIGWIETYSRLGWHGLFTGFTDKSLHYVYHLFGFALWKTFGFNGTGWMLSFVTLHALAATLSFYFFRKLFAAISPLFNTGMGLVAALLFFVSPYNTEVLGWYACVHYLVCTCLLLGCLLLFLRYTQRPHIKNLVFFYTLYLIAVFTLEISFTLPLIIGLLILFFPLPLKKPKPQLIFAFVLPALLAVTGYFILSKLLRGSFAGHYGAATHFNADPALLGTNLAKYSAKLFALAQFLDYGKREALYTFFTHKKVGYAISAGLLLAGPLVAVYWRKWPPGLRAAVVLLGMFVLALVPVLNLFFSYLVNIEGDRFSYFPTLFSSAFIAFVLFTILRKWAWLPVAALLFLNIQLLSINTGSWQAVAQIGNALVDDFKWEQAPRIYLLGIPDNFNGAYMFRSFEPDNSFAETVMLKKRKDFESRTRTIFEFNMATVMDSLTVKKINDNQLQVGFGQYGNWWWRHGIGAASYSTAEYDAVLGEWGTYTVTFKQKKEGSVYLYPCGGRWQQVAGF